MKPVTKDPILLRGHHLAVYGVAGKRKERKAVDTQFQISLLSAHRHRQDFCCRDALISVVTYLGSGTEKGQTLPRKFF